MSTVGMTDRQLTLRARATKLTQGCLAFCTVTTAVASTGCGEPSLVEIEESQAALVTSANAFCPTGFAFDPNSALCLSATEAVAPFAPSMVTFCKNYVKSRADGSNSCETKVGSSEPSIRWLRKIAVDAQIATKQVNGCPQGTSINPASGYCSDGTSLYGPFSRDDVAFCKTKVKATPEACETNRIAVGLTRPLKGGGSAEWAYIMPIDQGVRRDTSEGHFGAARANSSGVHSGIDFLAPIGTPLLSPCDSDTVLTGSDPFGYGNWVQIACPVPASIANGDQLWASIFFAHLSSTSAISGGRIARGARVGSVGKTGNAGAAEINAHVHFEITIQGSKQESINDLHGSADLATNPAAERFRVGFNRRCVEPNGIRTLTGPAMRGRRPDPFLMLSCLSRNKPALKAPPASLQATLERWSKHFSASTFNVDVGLPSVGGSAPVPPPPAPGGPPSASFDATTEIKVSNAGSKIGKLVLAIGFAEGTLNTDGSPTTAYFGHNDAGLSNHGLWSCTVCGGRQAKAADQYYYDQIIAPEVGNYLQNAGGFANHPMVAAAFFGLLTQSPEAALVDANSRDLSLINLLASGQLTAPVTEAKLTNLLVRAWTVNGQMLWTDPDTNTFNAARGRQDQLRRLQAYATALRANGVTPYP